MMDFYHHSRLLSCRSPQGAAVCGAKITLAASIALPAGSDVAVRLWIEGGAEKRVPMEISGGRAAATVQMPDHPCLVWYFFILTAPGGAVRYYGGDSGEGRFYDAEPPAYQITVYDQSFETPAPWRNGVCYQIFPDRFKRSSWEDFRRRAEIPASMGRPVRVHDRWDESPDWEAQPGQKNYDPCDYFGGDLNGIAEKLDYLASLGVSCIYLNPIFEAASNHRYNTADYHAVDPILGSEADFRFLTARAAERGIKLILDGVFSHTGSDSRYFNREGCYREPGAYQGEGSPYYEWYTFTRFPDEYESWWGFPTLPNVKELTPSYADFIAGENGVLAHWQGYGLAGWRLDVADELPDDFIKLIRKRLKALDPNAVLLGEVWEDCSNKFEGARRRDYVDGFALDGAMNYPFAKAVAAFLTGRIDAYGLGHALGMLREHYPEPFYLACMNLLSSHDDVRLCYQLAGAPDRMALDRRAQHDYRPSDENLLLAKRRVPLAFAIQIAHPGVPTLYYGDEAGVTGMSDPFNRTPFPWGSEDESILSAAKLLFPARRRHAVLQKGLTRMGALSGNVFAIVRYFADNTSVAVLFINAGLTEENVRLSPDTLIEGPDAGTPVTLCGTYLELAQNQTFTVQQDFILALPPLSFRLYIRGE